MVKQKHLENGGSAPHADEAQSRDRTETRSIWRVDEYLKFVNSWSKVQPLSRLTRSRLQPWNGHVTTSNSMPNASGGTRPGVSRGHRDAMGAYVRTSIPRQSEWTDLLIYCDLTAGLSAHFNGAQHAANWSNKLAQMQPFSTVNVGFCCCHSLGTAERKDAPCSSCHGEIFVNPLKGAFDKRKTRPGFPGRRSVVNRDHIFIPVKFLQLGDVVFQEGSVLPGDAGGLNCHGP